MPDVSADLDQSHASVMLLPSILSVKFSTVAMRNGEHEFQDLVEEVAVRVRRVLSSENRKNVRSRRLKAGPFRRHPINIVAPQMTPYPSAFLFTPDRLASLLSMSDRIEPGFLHTVLLLPEYFEFSGQILSAVSPDPGLLVVYLSPVRLYLQRAERAIWTGGGALYEELFRFVARESDSFAFVFPTGVVSDEERRLMERISDRYQMTHPVHRQELFLEE